MPLRPPNTAASMAIFTRFSRLFAVTGLALASVSAGDLFTVDVANLEYGVVVINALPQPITGAPPLIDMYFQNNVPNSERERAGIFFEHFFTLQPPLTEISGAMSNQFRVEVAESTFTAFTQTYVGSTDGLARPEMVGTPQPFSRVWLPASYGQFGDLFEGAMFFSAENQLYPHIYEAKAVAFEGSTTLLLPSVVAGMTLPAVGVRGKVQSGLYTKLGEVVEYTHYLGDYVVIDSSEDVPLVWEIWQAVYFSDEAGAIIPGISELYADPDRDGVPNVLEWCLATHPLQRSYAGTLLVTAGATTFSFERVRTLPQGVAFAVEEAAQVGGPWVAQTVTGTGDAYRQKALYSITKPLSPGAQRFYRFRVGMPF